MVDEVMKFITEADPEVGEAIEAEAARQRRNLELIASENIVSEPVMMAMGSVLTNKYAEGYPGKRYYGGCQCVDVVESIAIERAKKLFGCDYANVQPHSGAQANLAVYFALLEPGDTVLGMSLADGVELLPALVAAYTAQNPGTRIHLDAGYEPELIEKLDDGRLDFAILENQPVEPRIVNEVLGCRKLIFLAPDKAPYNQIVHPVPVEQSPYSILRFPNVRLLRRPNSLLHIHFHLISDESNL